jgi:hypothetical protein
MTVDKFERDERLEQRLKDAIPDTTAPDGLWERIEGALPTPKKPPMRWQMFIAAGATATAAIGIGFALRPAPPKPSGWTMGDRRLSIGEQITVGPHTKAMIKNPSLGKIFLTANTRFQIKDANGQKRLRLDEGTLEATVTAPPRLFAVETPNGVATDLGCAYLLNTRRVGRTEIGPIHFGGHQLTILSVTSGWVELADPISGIVLVPAKASCKIFDRSVGIPVFGDAPLRLAGLYSDPHVTSLRLTSAAGFIELSNRPKDSLTLFYLLYRFDGKTREAIWEKLITLVPPPSGVTKELALRLDKKTMEIYLEKLKPIWNPEASGAKLMPDFTSIILGEKNEKQ